MANIIRRPSWFIPDHDVTPESVYRNRRRFIQQLGLGVAAFPLLSSTAHTADAVKTAAKSYPYPRNPKFNPSVRLTDEAVATSYNNFYEFSLDKQAVRGLTEKFTISPWPIEIKGLCENPMKVDANELVSQMPMEERVYRFRCVEAWSMIVPWTGFQLSNLIEKAKPKPEAKFIRLETANRPDAFPGYTNPRTSGYPWPYFEGLRMEEAMHPLTLIATGIYGRALPKQNGAPIRLVVPWKYGYKSIKSVVKIEFVATQPKTFWEMLGPDEYPFESNVNPRVPHPRWSQATERVVDTGDRIRTQPYNGYAEDVAKLYPGA